MCARRVSLVAILASVLAVSGAAAADAAGAALPVSLREGHLVIVRGSIGHLADLRFLIDTGSVPTTIDRHVAARLRLRTERFSIVAFGQQVVAARSVLPEIRIGAVTVAGIPVAVSDLSFLGSPPIDAIVGIDVLTHLGAITLDYATPALRFESDSNRGGRVPLDFAGPLPTIQLSVESRPVRLLLDTGSAELILFHARVKGRLPNLPIGGWKTLNVASGAVPVRRIRLPAVCAGGREWKAVPALLSAAAMDGYPASVDGVLGVRALRLRELDIDFVSSSVNWR